MLSTRIKQNLNRLTALFNLRVDSRTAERRENLRLAALAESGHFNQAALPLLPQIEAAASDAIFSSIRASRNRFKSIAQSRSSAYSLDNDYFTTPDAEVLHAVLELYRPRRIIEIGSGNSTKLFRAAAEAIGLKLHITSVDPCPRADVRDYCDTIITLPVEQWADEAAISALSPGDILFIDSSHEVKPANDLIWLFFQALPRIASGVLVHLHDIFLPFDYPYEWTLAYPQWTEQYFLQAYLTKNCDYEVLWPGYHLQMSRADFESHFSDLATKTAKSFWMIKRQL